jgi:hypothetical protein
MLKSSKMLNPSQKPTPCGNSSIESFLKYLGYPSPQKELKDICSILKSSNLKADESSLLSENSPKLEIQIQKLINNSIKDKTTDTIEEWRRLKEKIIEKQKEVASNDKFSGQNAIDKSYIDERTNAVQSLFEMDKKLLDIADLYTIHRSLSSSSPSTNLSTPKNGEGYRNGDQ